MIILALLFLFQIVSSEILLEDKWDGDWRSRYTPFSKVASNGVVVNDPKGKFGKVLEVTYKKGIEGSDGGFSFPAPFSFAPQKKLCMSYSLLFPSNFPFEKDGSLTSIGGKLPGLMGGTPGYAWHQCSGFRQPEAHDFKCFTTRFMWREHGDGEVYGYLPSPTTDQCKQDPPFHCAESGHSLGRGYWRFPKDSWVKITQEISLNDVGSRNGYIKAWMGDVSYDKPHLNIQNIRVRDVHQDSLLRGYYFSTFFGGSGSEWAPPYDTKIYYSSIKIATSCEELLTSSTSTPTPTPTPTPRPTPTPTPTPRPAGSTPTPTPTPTPVASSTVTISPTSLTNAKGTSSGSVSSLAVKDQSEKANDAALLMTLSPATIYEGTFIFRLPSGVSSSNVRGVTLLWNFRGAPLSKQKWELLVLAKGSLVSFWDNRNAGEFGWVWVSEERSISLSGVSLSDLFTNGQLSLVLRSSNNQNVFKLDWLQLRVSVGSSTSAATDGEEAIEEVTEPEISNNSGDDISGSSGMAGWSVALVVLFSLVGALLLVVLVLLFTRSQPSGERF